LGGRPFLKILELLQDHKKMHIMNTKVLTIVARLKTLQLILHTEEYNAKEKHNNNDPLSTRLWLHSGNWTEHIKGFYLSTY